MTAHSIALFFHIIGAIGFFVALALEWTGLRNLQRSTTADDVRTWLPFVAGKSRFDGPSTILILVSGFYMARGMMRSAPWIAVTFGTIVAIAIGITISQPRLRAMTRAAGPDAAAAAVVSAPMLGLSLRVRLAMMLGIIVLMTFKPAMSESLMVIAAAATLGIISAVPLFRMQRSDRVEARISKE